MHDESSTAVVIEFHTAVDDPLGFALLILGKAYRQGARVLVTSTPERLQQLDRLLWTFEERSFLPHVLLSQASPSARARTPIWLAPEQSGAADEPRILLNLGADLPSQPESLQRLIEVIGIDLGEVEAGRERWRQYKSRGMDPRLWAADPVHPD